MPEFEDVPAAAEKPAAPPEAPAAEPTKDERTMAMLCHLGGIMGFLVPLIIWIIKKDESKFIDANGKEAVNFHITLLIGHVIGFATACITFGLINMALAVVGIIFAVMAGMAANEGKVYRYPMTIRMIT